MINLLSILHLFSCSLYAAFAASDWALGVPMSVWQLNLTPNTICRRADRQERRLRVWRDDERSNNPVDESRERRPRAARRAPKPSDVNNSHLKWRTEGTAELLQACESKGSRGTCDCETLRTSWHWPKWATCLSVNSLFRGQRKAPRSTWTGLSRQGANQRQQSPPLIEKFKWREAPAGSAL